MNPITTTQLENARQMTLPSSITAPIPDISSFTTVTPQMQEQQTQVNRAKKQQTDTLGSIFTGLTSLGERGATQISMEEQAGIPTLSRELVDVENQLRQKDLEFRREREAIQVTPGLTQAQMQARLADVSRKQSSELADLEVIRQARSNTLTNAQSLIDRKVELEFGDKKAKVDALKFIYDENKDLLSKEEDKLLSETIRREERAFNLAKSSFEQLENEKIQLVRNAQANGAGNNVMSAILNSKSLEEAYRNAGSFGMSIDDKIKLAKLREAGLPETAGIDAKILNTTQFKNAQAASNLKTTLQKAIDAVNKYGNYEKANAEGRGILDTLKVQLRSEISTALEQGVVQPGEAKSFDQIAGQLNKNIFIRDKKTLGSLNSLVDSMDKRIQSQKAALKSGFGVSDEAIDSALGILSEQDFDFQIDENGNIIMPGNLSNEEFFGN